MTDFDSQKAKWAEGQITAERKLKAALATGDYSPIVWKAPQVGEDYTLMWCPISLDERYDIVKEFQYPHSVGHTIGSYTIPAGLSEDFRESVTMRGIYDRVHGEMVFWEGNTGVVFDTVWYDNHASEVATHFADAYYARVCEAISKYTVDEFRRYFHDARALICSVGTIDGTFEHVVRREAVSSWEAKISSPQTKIACYHDEKNCIDFYVNQLSESDCKNLFDYKNLFLRFAALKYVADTEGGEPNSQLNRRLAILKALSGANNYKTVRMTYRFEDETCTTTIECARLQDAMRVNGSVVVRIKGRGWFHDCPVEDVIKITHGRKTLYESPTACKKENA